MASFSSLVKKSPLFARRFFYTAIPFQYRYGKLFRETLSFINKASTWTYNQKLEYQFIQLKDLVIFCDKNVEYYSRLFRTIGFNPLNIKDFEDFKKIPILNKDIIRANLDKLVTSNFRHKMYQISTSGSTGKKLTMFCDDNVFKMEAAFVLSSYHAHGATLYDKWSVWLRRFVPKGGSDIYFYDYELKRLYLSAYHMNEETIDFYMSKINEYKYHTLVGYPSSIYILAQLAQKRGLKLKHIRAIHTSSEMMLENWYDEIYQYFRIKPISHYGQIEKVAFFSQNSDTLFYELNPLYGYVEFDQNQLGTHDVIGTGFLNRCMPLLRYKTEDQVEIDPSVKNSFELIKKIHGRSSDILISSNNSRLPGVNFYSWIDKSVKGVSMFQIIQRSRAEVDFIFVKSNCFTENTILQIEQGLNERLGSLIYNIKNVDQIPRDPNTGKIRCIINLIQP